MAEFFKMGFFKEEAGFLNFEYSYLDLPGIFYKKWNPAVAPKPQMVIFNEDLAAELKNKADIFAGNTIIEGSTPFAKPMRAFNSGILVCWAMAATLFWEN
jgi:hypothetical protein